MLGGRDEGMGAPSQSSGFRDRGGSGDGGGSRQEAVAETQGGGDFEDDDIPF
jgi:hypothetical protein